MKITTEAAIFVSITWRHNATNQFWIFSMSMQSLLICRRHICGCIILRQPATQQTYGDIYSVVHLSPFDSQRSIENNAAAIRFNYMYLQITLSNRISLTLRNHFRYLLTANKDDIAEHLRNHQCYVCSAIASIGACAILLSMSLRLRSIWE